VPEQARALQGLGARLGQPAVTFRLIGFAAQHGRDRTAAFDQDQARVSGGTRYTGTREVHSRSKRIVD
jgi:hypothetical protein